MPSDIDSPDVETNDHENHLKAMATKEFTDEMIALLRIRAPLIYITSNEEKRLLAYFEHLSAARGYEVRVWDVCQGMVNLFTGAKAKGATDDMKDVEVALEKIIEQAKDDENNEQSMRSRGITGNIFLLLDFHRHMDNAPPTTERLLRKLCSIESMTTVVAVGPSLVLTPATENLFHVLDFPYPNREEILDTITNLVDSVQEKLPNLHKDIEGREDEIIQSAMGLTLGEAQDAFAKSVVQHRRFDIKTITDIKRQVIARKEILEYFSPKVTMDDVGGLETMIKWFEKRKMAFSAKAVEYGIISPPSGVLVLGLPGCVLGKTKIKVKKISNEGRLEIFNDKKMKQLIKSETK